MALSDYHPILYRSSVFRQRLQASIAFALRGDLATIKSARLPFRITRHRSPVLRKLGASDPELQRNKAKNLSIAAPLISGVLIRPGETFSFWKLVGPVSKEKGYVEGMILKQGRVTRDVGGGLCQLSNLIYWMALHTRLVVTERHRHSFDVFPDSGRTIPFGTGASIFSNYLDLRFKNEGSATFQIILSLTPELLEGEIRSDRPAEERFGIIERDHRYISENGIWYRENSIMRAVRSARTGQILREEFLYANRSRVMYEPSLEA